MHCFYRVFFTLWPRHVIDVSWFSPKHMGCACGLVSRYMGTYILKAIFSNFLFPSAFMSAALVWVCAKRPRKGRVLVIFFPCRGCRGRDRPLFFKDGGCDSSAGSFPVALSEQAVPMLVFCPLTVLLSQSQETRSSRRGQEMTSCSPQ